MVPGILGEFFSPEDPGSAPEFLNRVRGSDSPARSSGSRLFGPLDEGKAVFPLPYLVGFSLGSAAPGQYCEVR